MRTPGHLHVTINLVNYIGLVEQYNIMWTPGQLHVTINLVNYMDLVEQRTLGIEPGTSCTRGPILTNWAINATSLWSSSCSLSCPPLVPLGKRCGQGSLTIEGNPLLQKETPYYRKETTYYRKTYRTIERKSLTIIEIIRGNPIVRDLCV